MTTTERMANSNALNTKLSDFKHNDNATIDINEDQKESFNINKSTKLYKNLINKKDNITNSLLRNLVNMIKELKENYDKNINIKEENHE